MTDRPSTKKGRRPRSRMRRRVTGALALALALGSVGVAYATVAAAATPRAQAAAAANAPASEPVDVRKGRAALRDQLHHLPRAEPAGRRRTAARR